MLERKEIMSPNGLSPESHAAEIRGGLEGEGWIYEGVLHDGRILFTRPADYKKKN